MSKIYNVAENVYFLYSPSIYTIREPCFSALLSRPGWSRGNVLASKSKVQIRLRSMDFSGRKNPEHKSSGRDFKLGGLESEISGSLKNLKPENKASEQN